MKQHKKGIRVTKQKLKEDLKSIEMKRCVNPTLEEEKIDHLSESIVSIDKKDGIMYIDLTGNSPVRSIDRYTVFLYCMIGQQM